MDRDLISQGHAEFAKFDHDSFYDLPTTVRNPRFMGRLPPIIYFRDLVFFYNEPDLGRDPSALKLVAPYSVTRSHLCSLALLGSLPCLFIIVLNSAFSFGSIISLHRITNAPWRMQKTFFAIPFRSFQSRTCPQITRIPPINSFF